MNNLGLKIKELRIETELTQGELAKVLGITQDSISLWEKGKHFTTNCRRILDKRQIVVYNIKRNTTFSRVKNPRFSSILRQFVVKFFYE